MQAIVQQGKNDYYIQLTWRPVDDMTFRLYQRHCFLSKARRADDADVLPWLQLCQQQDLDRPTQGTLHMAGSPPPAGWLWMSRHPSCLRRYLLVDWTSLCSLHWRHLIAHVTTARVCQHFHRAASIWCTTHDNFISQTNHSNDTNVRQHSNTTSIDTNILCTLHCFFLFHSRKSQIYQLMHVSFSVKSYSNQNTYSTQTSQEWCLQTYLQPHVTLSFHFLNLKVVVRFMPLPRGRPFLLIGIKIASFIFKILCRLVWYQMNEVENTASASLLWPGIGIKSRVFKCQTVMA